MPAGLLCCETSLLCEFLLQDLVVMSYEFFFAAMLFFYCGGILLAAFFAVKLVQQLLIYTGNCFSCGASLLSVFFAVRDLCSGLLCYGHGYGYMLSYLVPAT